MAKSVQQHKPASNQEKNPEVIVPDEIRREIENMVPDEKKRNRLVMAVAQVFYARSAPLPAPKELKEYDRVVPGLAERIVKRFEIQSDHRISLEKIAIPSQIGESKRGQWMGFVITLIALGMSCYLAMNGHETVASIIGGSTVLGLAATFVAGKKIQKKNLEEKDSKS